MILIINGPNLNRLGLRDNKIYGSATLPQLEEMLNKRFGNDNLEFFQSNCEGEIIDKIQECGNGSLCSGIVINPGAYAHYSYAIADAIADAKIPVVEVHISNIHSREEFRRKSVTAANCIGVISGLGAEGYALGIEWLIKRG